MGRLAPNTPKLTQRHHPNPPPTHRPPSKRPTTNPNHPTTPQNQHQRTTRAGPGGRPGPWARGRERGQGPRTGPAGHSQEPRNRGGHRGAVGGGIPPNHSPHTSSTRDTPENHRPHTAPSRDGRPEHAETRVLTPHSPPPATGNRQPATVRAPRTRSHHRHPPPPTTTNQSEERHTGGRGRWPGPHPATQLPALVKVA